MKSIKDAANQLKPFFLANGFFRKGNNFIKIENCFIFLICFHHGCALTPEFYVIPLYYPYSMKTIPFGSNFCDYKNQQVKFVDYYQVDERYPPIWLTKTKGLWILTNGFMMLKDSVRITYFLLFLVFRRYIK